MPQSKQIHHKNTVLEKIRNVTRNSSGKRGSSPGEMETLPDCHEDNVRDSDRKYSSSSGKIEYLPQHHENDTCDGTGRGTV